MLIQNVSNAGQTMPPVARVSTEAPSSATPAPSDTPASSVKPSPEQLKGAVDSMNLAMKQSHQSLEFSVDKATQTPVVKMTDTTTGEVIGQFPSEAVLAIAQSIEQMQPGAFLKQKA